MFIAKFRGGEERKIGGFSGRSCEGRRTLIVRAVAVVGVALAVLISVGVPVLVRVRRLEP